ncbi:MAG: hypothetical protein RL172_310 [Bacteroidota bacterium]|jgi:hypothetical protein
MHSFTQEDLLLYVYGDTSADQTAAIRQALEVDWKLKEEYDALVSVQQQLSEIQHTPRKKAIDFILAYAGKPVQELSGQEG